MRSFLGLSTMIALIPAVPFRSILLVAFLWFIPIGIIFAQSPANFQFQTTCSGPVNGSIEVYARVKSIYSPKDTRFLTRIARGQNGQGRLLKPQAPARCPQRQRTLD